MLARVSMYAVRRAPSCAKLTRAAHAMVMLSGENALDDIAGDSGRSRTMEELEGVEGRRRFSGVYIPCGVSWRKHVDISTCTFSVKESSTVFESENSQPVLPYVWQLWKVQAYPPLRQHRGLSRYQADTKGISSMVVRDGHPCTKGTTGYMLLSIMVGSSLRTEVGDGLVGIEKPRFRRQ